MCRRKGKRVLIGWGVRRPLARCIWRYRSSSCVFSRIQLQRCIQGAATIAETHAMSGLPGGGYCPGWRHHRRMNYDPPPPTYQHQHTPAAIILNARAELYARQGYASMVHLISQAQLLWDRRLFPLGHTPTTPCKRQFVHTRRDPNNASYATFR